MTDLTLKKIEEVLDKKLDQKLEPIKKTLDEHSDKLDALTLDMINVQKKQMFCRTSIVILKTQKKK